MQRSGKVGGQQVYDGSNGTPDNNSFDGGGSEKAQTLCDGGDFNRVWCRECVAPVPKVGLGQPKEFNILFIFYPKYLPNKFPEISRIRKYMELSINHPDSVLDNFYGQFPSTRQGKLNHDLRFLI
jgi:hypothetical protein